MLTPKLLRTITVIALVFGLALWTVSYVAAADPVPQGGGTWGCVGPGCSPQPAPPTGGGTWGCAGPGCNPPAQQPAQPGPRPPAKTVVIERDRGSALGAAAAGTMLGIAVGSMANQPRQEPKPQVVVIQQPPDDGATQQKNLALALELERERSKRLTLEIEIERLKAERKK